MDFGAIHMRWPFSSSGKSFAFRLLYRACLSLLTLISLGADSVTFGLRRELVVVVPFRLTVRAQYLIYFIVQLEFCAADVLPVLRTDQS